MTGRRPDTLGVYDNAKHFRATLPDVQTLPQLFQKAGYFTARVGKIYHYGVPGQIGTDGLDDPPSWQLRGNPRGRDKVDEEKVIQVHGERRGMGGALSYLAADGTDEEQTDGMVASQVIDLMEERRGQPFFLACGFFRPHVPSVAPRAYFDLHPRQKFTLPLDPPGHRESLPAPALNNQAPHYGIPQEKLIDFLQGYHASISFMDAQVGRVLNSLDRLGLAENTIVVFFGDHGWLLGEHGLWQKMSLFEESARVPLLIAAPGARGNGQASPRTVELLDVYPTVAELCGLAAPGAEGRSLRALLNNPVAKWDKPAYTQVDRGPVKGRSVRTERFRYTEWDGGKLGSELYDHERDFREYMNLAADPAQTATVQEMKRLLAKVFKTS